MNNSWKYFYSKMSHFHFFKYSYPPPQQRRGVRPPPGTKLRKSIAVFVESKNYNLLGFNQNCNYSPACTFF